MNLKLKFQTILTFLQDWLRPPRTLRITQTGWRFLGLTVVIGFAAVNTGNNLLYLVFGLMLSFITASGVLSELMLRQVAPVRAFPKHIFAGLPAPVIVTLTNQKKYVSSYSLLLEDFSPGNPVGGSAYLLKIPARQAVTVTYPMVFARRGLHRPGKIRLSTRYPFGFFHKSATFIETEDEVLVYPALAKLQPADLPSPSVYAGEFETSKKGAGFEIHGVREYAPGDSNSRIHWRSTAKLDRLMTKEFDDQQRKRVALVLDVSFPGKPFPVTFLQDGEHAISLAAAYARHFLKNNFQFQLITPDQRSAFDQGQSHLFAILRMLALLQPSNGRNRQHLTSAIRNLQRTNVIKILISTNNANGYKFSNFSKIMEVH